MEFCNYKELIVVTHIACYLVGVVTGIYFASQISEDIDKRIKK